MADKKHFNFTLMTLLLIAAGGLAQTCQPAGAETLITNVCPACGHTLSRVASPVAAEPCYVTVAATNQAESVASVATGKLPAPKAWKSSIYGGFAAKSGNTTSSSYNYGGDFLRDGQVYRGRLKVDGSYSQAERQVTVSKSEVSGEMRRMLDERWFAYGILSALHDEIKDLSYRTKTGPGMGYYFFDSKDLTVDVSSGPLYVQEKKAGLTSGYLAWRFAQGVSWQMTDTFRWWESVEADVDTTDTAAYVLAFKTGIESKINNNLSLIFTVKDDYDSRPEAAGKIKRNDMEVSTGLRYAF